MCNVKAEDAGEIRFVSGDVESTAYLEVEGTTAVTVLCVVWDFKYLENVSSHFRTPSVNCQTIAGQDSFGETSCHPGVHHVFN